MPGEQESAGAVDASDFAIRDPQAFAANLGRAIESASRALSLYLQKRQNGEMAEAIAGPLQEVLETLGEVGRYWTGDPKRTIEAQSLLMGQYFAIWTAAVQSAALGAAFAPVVAPLSGDKRFQDPLWSKNAFFGGLMQIYLATTRWALDLVDRTEGIDEATRIRARFYVQQIANAIAPTNFLATNPEVLKETAQSNGENLARGMAMLVQDIEAGRGALKMRQVPPGAFRLGETLATTPGKVIHQNDVCQVIQYASATESVFKRPLLIVPPWINKYYILDLTPEKSFVRWLVDQGHTVFVVSWINPEARHATKTFDDYMREGILESLDVVRKATGEAKVNTIGYCVGGTLLAVALAWLAEKGEADQVASATLLTAQTDFSQAGDLKIFTGERSIEALEKEVEKTGYLDGSKMAATFNLLRSNDLIWPYVINNYMKGKDPFPFDLLFWNSDSTRMPAANHLFYLRNCYLQNKLAKGELEVGGVTIDLKKVETPVYTLATREDHIAPAKSVFLGARLFGGPVKFVLSGSGHIAGVVNPPARRKYQYWTGGAPEGSLDEWLKSSEEHPGSWWEDWQSWIEALDATKVKKKRRPGGGKFKAIEDAPGSYVRAQS